MNWLERAQREIRGRVTSATANTAEGQPTAAMAVFDPLISEERGAPNGGDSCPPPTPMYDAEALHEDFEERAAIMKFDGGMSSEDAEQAAWALVLKHRWLH